MTEMVARSANLSYTLPVGRHKFRAKLRMLDVSLHPMVKVKKHVRIRDRNHASSYVV